MTKLLTFLAFISLSIPAFAQSQGVSMRATNGIGYGTTVINSLVGKITTGNVTNAAGSRVAYLSDTNGLGNSGDFVPRSGTNMTGGLTNNIRFDGNAAGLTNVQPENIVSNGNQIVNGVLSTNSLNGGFYTQTGDKRKLTLDGSGLTNISSAALPSNVATNNGNNQFSAAQTVNGNFIATGTTNYIAGTNVVQTKLTVGGASTSTADAVNVTGALTTSGGITASSGGGFTSGSSSFVQSGLSINASGSYLGFANSAFFQSPLSGVMTLTGSSLASGGGKLLFGGASTVANSAGSTNWPMLSPGSKTNGLNYAELSVMAGTNTTEFASIKANQLYSTNSTGNTVTITNGNLTASGLATFTNGIATFAKNTPTSITVAGSPVNFTNTTTANVTVYVDGVSVTGTVGINGTTVFNTIGQNTLSQIEPGDWVTITYTIGTPTAWYR